MIQWIKDNCLNSKGILNNRVLEETWWQKSNDRQEHLKQILDGHLFSSIKRRIYLILNPDSTGLCEICGKETNWNKTKFLQYCSSKCAANSETTAEKRKKTVKEKYGVEYISQSKDIQEKIKENEKSISGFESKNQRHYSKDIFEKLSSKDWLHEQHLVLKRNVIDIAKEIGVDFTTILKRLKDFDLEYKTYSHISLDQKEIGQFLIDMGYDVEYSNKSIITPYELDIFIEKAKFAIEFCSLYWHSETFGKDKNYHYNKFKWCKENGIHLITIFEDDWKIRKEQVKGYIESKLNVNQRLFARNTKFKEIDKKTANSFYEKYHIQGTHNNIINSYGLFYKDELVSAISFAQHHRNNTQNVLVRLCYKRNISVVGGLEKLIKNSGHNNFISWSDNRWSTGRVYERTGFIKEEELNPDYSYVFKSGPIQRFSKQNFKKANLKDLLEGETELEWCTRNGYVRIWDCGKIRWLYKKD